MSNKIVEISNYLILAASIASLHGQRKTYSKDDFEQLIAQCAQNPLLDTVPTLSKKALCCYHIARCLYYEMTHDFNRSYEEHYQVIEIWHKHETWQLRQPENWLNLLNVQYLAAMQAGKLDRAAAIIEELKKITPLTEQLYQHIKISVLNKEIALGVISYNPASIINTLQEFEVFTKEKPERINTTSLISALQYALAAYFILGNYTNAFATLQSYFCYDCRGDSKSDNFFNVVEILLLIEEKAWTTALSKIKSLLRHLAKDRQADEHLLLFIKALHEWIKTKKEDLKRQILEKCLADMLVYNNLPQYNIFFDILDYNLWLRSKLDSKTLLEHYETHRQSLN